MRIGFDIGSKNVSVALVNGSVLIEYHVFPHNGEIARTYSEIIRDLKARHTFSGGETYGITGSIDLPGLAVFDPILASVEAHRWQKTGCRAILSIGCERFYLILLDENGNYIEHTINSDCASGTGSFIDQQAERLGCSSEELAEKANAYQGSVPSISTRCAVFAKSDIIHSQAQGFSKDAIACGICEGVVRTVLDNTIKGHDIPGAILFIGGMSNNRKVTSEIGKRLKQRIITLPEGQAFNAIGAALLGTETGFSDTRLAGATGIQHEKRSPLAIHLTDYPDFGKDRFYVKDDIEITQYDDLKKNAYAVSIGIDIGSTSTKAVVLNEQKHVLVGLYTKTKGDPVEAVSKLFTCVRTLFNGKRLDVRGVATTGSGRKLIKEVLCADFALNEISAHAIGATFIDPTVDTIIEIGGQDSKFTTMSNGMVTNATMNYVCAAGTGSFIEEQAGRLGITLDEISDMALGQSAPYTSDRCTVYMERDLNIFLSEGWDKREIIAAVLYSVRDNYLSKVVGKSAIGDRVYFQGATARNKALVAVFEQELDKPILVSKFCHLTGALGCALQVMGQEIGTSRFSGIDFRYDVESEVCSLCTNRCDLRIYTVNGMRSAWGMKCGRDYSDTKRIERPPVSTLEERYASLFSKKKQETHGALIGIPQAIYMAEFGTLFDDFFTSLGYQTVIERSNARAMSVGKTLVNADFCAPMVLAHGLVASLYDKNVDYIFFPSIINEQSYCEKLPEEEKYVDKMSDCYFCYYSQYAPTIIGNLPSLDLKKKLISPMIKLNNRPIETVANDLSETLETYLDRPRQELSDAFIAAYNRFMATKKSWQMTGENILNEHPTAPAILLLGRPYALFDQRINLGIPHKIESMGHTIFYQSMLPLTVGDTDTEVLKRMHWYYGQQILLAAEYVRKHDAVYPVFLTCFRCSPDSYILTYFKEMMKEAGKPYLVIQLDEHTSDVGYETRIEAALDSFQNDFVLRTSRQHVKRSTVKTTSRTLTKGDTVLIPYISSIISEIQRDAFEAAGFNARVLTVDRHKINRGYRYSSGGECMPNVAIVGSLIEAVEREGFAPNRTHLYLPTLCLACNFNQYPSLITVACRNAGLNDISVINPNALRGVPEVPILQANIMGSILYKLYFRHRPYEKNVGDTEEALRQSMTIVRSHIFEKKNLIDAASLVRKVFECIPVRHQRRPLIGILGDLYTKYNEILNEDIFRFIEELGGEVLVPSINELAINFLYADFTEHKRNKLILKMFVQEEEKFERVFAGMIDTHFEPPINECMELLSEFGITHHIIGETTINVSRMLYYIKHNIVSGVVHLNPVFCCPGVVSSSIFRKVQDTYGVPIIDLFYDGTNKPNKRIVPHLYYLTKNENRGDYSNIRISDHKNGR